MDFHEADRRRTVLSGQLTRGQITHDTFTASVNTLRVTDAAGRTWKPASSPTGWLCWNGTVWQDATPQGFTDLRNSQAGTKDFNEFKSSLMTVDEFRRISKDVPLAKRPQKWWDLLSILGGIAGAILWFLYGSVRSGQEGFDFITPLLMIAIPVIMVWFRGDIDQILRPLQPHRKKISRIILIGLGIAIPFLTAWILYNIFHLSQYPLMQANMVVGTFTAYAITRDPQLGSVFSKKGPVAGTAMVIFTIILCSCVIAPVFADDCERDPLNAQDCLRTSGYAEALAGFFSSILNILVNGPIILQGIFQGAAGAATAGAAAAGAGAAGAQPPYNGPYVGDRREFTDHRGQRRSAVLQADGHWVSEDEGTWVDMDKLDDARQDYEEGQKWIKDQQVKESEKFIAQTEEYAKQLEAIKNYKSPEREAFEKWYREYLELSQKTNEFSMNMHHNQANIMSGLTKTAEWTLEGADFGVDVLSNMTGPAGKGIKTAYTTIKDISKNVSASYANGEDMKDGLAKGVAEAAFDFAFDKAKDKFSKITQGKVPFFKNFKGGNFPDVPDDVISNALNKKAAQSILEQRIRNAAQGSMNKAVQGRIQKGLVKDPLKKLIGLK